MKLKSLLLTCALTCTLLPTLLPPPAQAMPVQSLIQTPMPEWYQEGFTRGHLNIPLMMKMGFSRLEAVEIQNQMKDILEADPDYMKLEYKGLADELFQDPDELVLKALETALDQVKNKKHLESGFQARELKAHEFYVAFDMDETLLTQWYSMGGKGPQYRDLEVQNRDFILRPDLKGPTYLSMTPGWQKALKELVQIPGCQGIVIFTAKEDKAAQEIIDKLTLDGKPLRPFLKGVFTRNYLVRDSKSVKLSKDLRIIDESLEHVVLIDDNPSRIFPGQVGNLREIPKYNPDAYYTARDRKDRSVTSLIENYLPVVVNEIRDAARYSREHNVSFRQAFYPYSMGGSAELLMLLKQGHSMSEAVQSLRGPEREVFEPQFYIPPQPKKAN